MLQDSLVDIGLSDKESGVYLALLELGKGTVSQISRKANINRTTGYDILDTLSSKGLVSISGKEPKQEYSAEAPEHLASYIQTEIEKKNEAFGKTIALIPELKSIHNVGGRPQVRFYEGLDGLQKVYEDTLSSCEEIRAYASVEDIAPTLPYYFPEYYKRRAKKGIAIRAIFPESADAHERARLDNEEIRQSRIVSREKYAFHPEINIYDNKMMIASWREKLGIIIESSEIADAMKQIFELAWDRAGEIDLNKYKK